MKTFWIVVAALATAAFLFLGKERDGDFYLAALASGWVFFRLTVGSDCPIVWLLGKLGAKGLSCPAELKK